MKLFFLSYLAFLARMLIKIKKPYIIGITGTVWKTTVSSYVSELLVAEYGRKNVGFSQYNYNGEYGLPLTIIGAKTPGKNPFLWIFLFFQTCLRIITPYPKYLVLEYGIDHPGEMTFLLSIAHPKIVVITPIESNHLEQFWTFERYRAEKLKITKHHPLTLAHESLRGMFPYDGIYYGLGARSDVDASHIVLSLQWTTAQIHDGSLDFSVQLPSIGEFQVENILPLYPIARILGIDRSVIAPVVARAFPKNGRSRIISAKYDTTVIDGTYNGGYTAIREGIRSMKSFESSCRILFFLGDMRELGEKQQELHETLADFIIENVSRSSSFSFFLVWPLMQQYVAPRLQEHFFVKTFLSSRLAGSEIQKLLSTDVRPSVLYAKWSQNTVFLEEWLKYILHKKDFSLLPRQSDEWLKKKADFFARIEV